MISADRSPSSTMPDVSEEQINSELQILESDDVLSAVADPSWDTAHTANLSPGMLREHEEKLLKLRSSLTLAPIRKSNVIEVSVLAPTAAGATDILRKLSGAYFLAHERLARPQGSTNFFAQQAEGYKTEWRDAEDRLMRFQKDSGLVSVPDTETKLNERINTLQDARGENNAQVAAISHQVAADLDQLQGLKQRNETQIHTTSNQTSTEALRGQLLQFQNRRTELLTRYKSSDRLVAEVDHEIATTTAALGEAESRAGVDRTTDINPNWQRVQADLIHDTVSRKALLAKGAELEKNTAALQEQLRTAETLGLQYGTLQEAVQQAKSNYETFSQKWDQQQIEDAMDSHSLSNVAIAEAPTSSYRPASPRRLMNYALGGLTSLFLVAGLLYLLESGRTTFAAPYELEQYSKSRVLATIALVKNPALTEPDVARTATAMNEVPRSQAAAPELALAATLQSTQQGVRS